MTTNTYSFLMKVGMQLYLSDQKINVEVDFEIPKGFGGFSPSQHPNDYAVWLYLYDA